MAAFNLLDVLRQLDVRAVDSIFETTDYGWGWAGARLACTELRDCVDFNVRAAKLCLTWDATMGQTRRMGNMASPLARFWRCESLKIRFGITRDDSESDDDDGDIRHPSLLAAWCVAGIGAEMARNITVLSLEGPLDLPTLTTVSLVLAGTLRHVHTLKLNTDPCGAGGFRDAYAIHSALRGAFPALQELCLPAMACLRGLEAFDGSAPHTVRVLTSSELSSVRMSHVRSLLRLSQLRHLDLRGEAWDATWEGDDYRVWDDVDADDDADEGIPAGADAELALGDATLLEELRELPEEEVQGIWALRRLIALAPPELESLRLHVIFQEIDFVGGRITRAVESYDDIYVHHLRFAAAALLPRLEATGQRLPLLKVELLLGKPGVLTSLLQPHSAFARLLAKCDRMELGLLHVYVGPPSVHPGTETAAAAATLQAVARAMGGGLPDQLEISSKQPSWYCTLQLRPRCQQRGGVAAADGRCDSGGRGTGGAATAAPAAVMELTTEQVLERAADKMWAAASVQCAASMAGATMDAHVAAAGAADSRSPWLRYNGLERMLLLGGPFVWQLTCGPGAGGSARLLTDWLGSLVAAGRPLPPAAAAAGTAEDAVGTAGRAIRGCSFASCGSGSAMAVVPCGHLDAELQLQLYQAAAAAACKTPSFLQVSATCGFGWSSAIEEVIQELWDDHRRSTPQPAAAVARAAAARTAAGADGPAYGGSGGGGGPPAKTNAAGAGGEPGQAPGGEPTGDAAAGGGGGDDLQALMRLLPLLVQAHAAVVRVELGKS